MKKTEPKSFESSLTQLEKVVRDLESGDLPLERSLELFEQGVRLSRECQERLQHAERRIEMLLEDEAGQPLVAEFDPADYNGVAPATDFAVTDLDEDESVF